MTTRRPFTTAAVIWPLIALVALATRIGWASPLSTLEYVAWGFFGIMPLAIAWILKRSQPDASMTQVIADAERDAVARPPAVPRG